jgi:hypothetical protein
MGRWMLMAVILSLALLPLYPSGSLAGASEAGNDPLTRAPGEQLYPDPNITLRFDRDEFMVDPHPETGGDTIVSGTIICLVPEVVPSNIFCEVILTGYSTEIQSSDIVQLLFNKHTVELDFRMGVMVPWDVRGNTRLELDIELKWKYDGTGQGGAYPDHYPSTLYIPPYGELDLGTVNRMEILALDVGSWETVLFEVSNHGNMKTEMKVDIVTLPPGMEMEIEEDSFTVNSYQSRIVRTRIRQKEGEGKEGSIILRISTDIPDERSRREFEFDVRTESQEGLKNPDSATIMFIIVLAVFIILMAVFAIILRRLRKQN